MSTNTRQIFYEWDRELATDAYDDIKYLIPPKVQVFLDRFNTEQRGLLRADAVPSIRVVTVSSIHGTPLVGYAYELILCDVVAVLNEAGRGFGRPPEAIVNLV